MPLGSVSAAKAPPEYVQNMRKPDPERELQTKQIKAARQEQKAQHTSNVDAVKREQQVAKVDQARLSVVRKSEAMKNAKPVVNSQGQTTGRIVNTSA